MSGLGMFGISWALHIKQSKFQTRRQCLRATPCTEQAGHFWNGSFALRDRDLQTPQYSGAAGAFRAFNLTEFQLWVCEGLHQEYTRPPYSRISVKLSC